MADRLLTFDGATWLADLSVADGAMVMTDGLETAVTISLFTDRRAREDDVLPDGPGGDRRGWWADAFSDDQPTGSRLWLLRREKMMPEVLLRAKEYAEEALAWMLTSRVAQRVDVIAEAAPPDALALWIRIVKPDGQIADYRYRLAWSAHAL